MKCIFGVGNRIFYYYFDGNVRALVGDLLLKNQTLPQKGDFEHGKVSCALGVKNVVAFEFERYRHP